MKKKIAVLTTGWSIDFIIPVFKGMQNACKELNADLYIFCCYPFSETDGSQNTTGFAIYDLMDYRQFDGIVVMPNLFNNSDTVSKWHKRLLDYDIPSVSVNYPLEGISSVLSDNRAAYKELILHLIKDHNTLSFAYIGGPDGDAGSLSNYRTYREALTESNISIDESLIFTNGDWSYKWAAEQAEKIFDGKHKIPQAIVCINDWAAMAAINVASKHNYSVPEDIKVIGFDDVFLSKKVIPSITSVNLNSEQIGREAIDVLINTPKDQVVCRNINAEPVYRQSCGCFEKITNEQILYSQNFSQELDIEQRFASQLRHMEDNFIRNITMSSVIGDLQKYFEKRHTFEGENFAILINQNVIDSLNDKKTDSVSTCYDKTVKTVAHLINGKAADCPKISSLLLTPPSMINPEESGNLYLFLPIFNRKYLQGYYVSKNDLSLIENKRGYNWTRNFGAIIEKFRQTAIYCRLSEQMKILSTQDALSGLLNRSGLDSYASDLFDFNNKAGNSTVILFLDINNMKLINDRFGHLHGDLAVKTVAEAIQKIVPSDFLCVRYGGDEFVVIGTYDVQKSSETSSLIPRIDRKLYERARRMTLPYELTVSCGYKIFSPYERMSLTDAIKDVDELMYRAKKQFHENNR